MDYIKRHTRLTFEALMLNLHESHLVFLSSLFSSAMLGESLREESLRKELIKKTYVMVPEKLEDSIKIDGNLIYQTIFELGKLSNIPYLKSCEMLSKKMGQFIRNRFLNEPYEIIMNYLEGLEKSKSTKLRKILFNEPWFRILYLLRNNASHFNNYGRYIKSDWIFREDKVIWGTLIINKSDIGHEIRYTDREIILLMHHTINYLETNRFIFE